MGIEACVLKLHSTRLLMRWYTRSGRFMALHPERWDYGDADVPSALTEDMAAHQEARAAQKKARHREKEKVQQHAFASDQSCAQ